MTTAWPTPGTWLSTACAVRVCRHILGFLSKRSELLGSSAEEGLAAYVYTIGLPSLLFTHIATVLRCAGMAWPPHAQTALPTAFCGAV